MKTPVLRSLFPEAEACNFLKKRLWHNCFPENFAKLLRTSFFQNTSSGCFCNEICLWGRWNPSIKTKMVLFVKRIFLITNSLKLVYLLSKKWLSITMGLFPQFSERFWSFKCNISSFCVCDRCYCHYMCITLCVTLYYINFGYFISSWIVNI